MLPDAGNMGEIAVVGTRGSKNGILAFCKGLVYSTMNQSPSGRAALPRRHARPREPVSVPRSGRVRGGRRKCRESSSDGVVFFVWSDYLRQIKIQGDLSRVEVIRGIRGTDI
jgi:hypothetical protein